MSNPQDPKIQEAIRAVNRLGVNGEALMNPPPNSGIPENQQFRIAGTQRNPIASLNLGQKGFYMLGLTTSTSRFVAVTASAFIIQEILNPFDIDKKDDRMERLGLSLVAGGVAAIFF